MEMRKRTFQGGEEVVAPLCHFLSPPLSADTMEGRCTCEDKAKRKYFKRMHDKVEARPSTSCSRPGKDSKCCYRAIEFGCSACLLCFSCPLSIVCCCVMLPCKIGWKAVKQAKQHWSCCGSEKKGYAAYSSFSDIDSNTHPLQVQIANWNVHGVGHFLSMG